MGSKTAEAAVSAQSPQPPQRDVDSRDPVVSAKANEVAEATSDEVERARSFEVKPVDETWQTSDSRRLVRFKAKRIVHLKNSMFRCGSEYTIQDKYLRLSVKVESTLSKESIEGSIQRVWFLPDGQILIYEGWFEGAGPHEFTVLVSPDYSRGRYSLHYLEAPSFNGGEPRLDLAPPEGVLSGELYYRAMQSGRVFKKRLDQIDGKKPTQPFSIG